jgi:hypothetical protein
VVVKVTTDDYRSVGVLYDDVSDDFRDSHNSLLQVLLFSWIEIAVENLDIVVAELQLGPREICSEWLHELESGVVSRRIPASATALLQGLVRPKATEIEWRLQLGLIETDHLRSVVFQEIIYDLLLGLRVQTSDIEGDQFELSPFSFDSGEISIDSGSLFVGDCVPSTVSVASSIPTRTVVFLFGLLLLWYQSRVDLAIGLIPSESSGIFLGLLLLLRQLLIFNTSSVMLFNAV